MLPSQRNFVGGGRTEVPNTRLSNLLVAAALHGELSDHATYAFTARRLSLPRFFCNLRTILSILQIWARTNTEDETPRTNTADEHFSFFVRSGRSPSPIVAAPRRGRTRFLPHLRIRLAKDICCMCGKKESLY